MEEIIKEKENINLKTILSNIILSLNGNLNKKDKEFCIPDVFSLSLVDKDNKLTIYNIPNLKENLLPVSNNLKEKKYSYSFDKFWIEFEKENSNSFEVEATNILETIIKIIDKIDTLSLSYKIDDLVLINGSKKRKNKYKINTALRIFLNVY